MKPHLNYSLGTGRLNTRANYKKSQSCSPAFIRIFICRQATAPFFYVQQLTESVRGCTLHCSICLYRHHMMPTFRYSKERNRKGKRGTACTWVFIPRPFLSSLPTFPAFTTVAFAIHAQQIFCTWQSYA